MYKTAIFA